MKLNLLVSCELLDGPLEGVVLWDVNCASCGGVEAWTLHVLRYWDVDVDIVGDALLLVVTLDLDDETDLGVRGILHDYIYCEEGLYSNVQPVTHQLEFSIGRDEGNQSFVFEAAQPYTLVEFDIVEFNSFVLGRPALGLVVGLVVESQLEIRHARELAVRVNYANYLALDDIVGRTD
jgi:hypothetical protein